MPLYYCPQRVFIEREIGNSDNNFIFYITDSRVYRIILNLELAHAPSNISRAKLYGWVCLRLKYYFPYYLLHIGFLAIQAVYFGLLTVIFLFREKCSA